jgi:hypothetical protein
LRSSKPSTPSSFFHVSYNIETYFNEKGVSLFISATPQEWQESGRFLDPMKHPYYTLEYVTDHSTELDLENLIYIMIFTDYVD